MGCVWTYELKEIPTQFEVSQLAWRGGKRTRSREGLTLSKASSLSLVATTIVANELAIPLMDALSLVVSEAKEAVEGPIPRLAE